MSLTYRLADWNLAQRRLNNTGSKYSKSQLFWLRDCAKFFVLGSVIQRSNSGTNSTQEYYFCAWGADLYATWVTGLHKNVTLK